MRADVRAVRLRRRPGPQKGREQSAVAGGPSASAAASWTDSRGMIVAPQGDLAREASLAHQPGEGEVRHPCASGVRLVVVNRERQAGERRTIALVLTTPRCVGAGWRLGAVARWPLHAPGHWCPGSGTEASGRGFTCRGLLRRGGPNDSAWPGFVRDPSVQREDRFRTADAVGEIWPKQAICVGMADRLLSAVNREKISCRMSPNSNGTSRRPTADRDDSNVRG